jgi:hypothetical protein
MASPVCRRWAWRTGDCSSITSPLLTKAKEKREAELRALELHRGRPVPSVPMHDVEEAASHANPLTSTPYNRGPQSVDWYAILIVATPDGRTLRAARSTDYVHPLRARGPA